MAELDRPKHEPIGVGQGLKVSNQYEAGWTKRFGEREFERLALVRAAD